MITLHLLKFFFVLVTEIDINFAEVGWYIYASFCCSCFFVVATSTLFSICGVINFIIVIVLDSILNMLDIALMLCILPYSLLIISARNSLIITFLSVYHPIFPFFLLLSFHTIFFLLKWENVISFEIYVSIKYRVCTKYCIYNYNHLQEHTLEY